MIVKWPLLSWTSCFGQICNGKADAFSISAHVSDIQGIDLRCCTSNWQVLAVLQVCGFKPRSLFLPRDKRWCNTCPHIPGGRTSGVWRQSIVDSSHEADYKCMLGHDNTMSWWMCYWNSWVIQVQWLCCLPSAHSLPWLRSAYIPSSSNMWNTVLWAEHWTSFKTTARSS